MLPKRNNRKRAMINKRCERCDKVTDNISNHGRCEKCQEILDNQIKNAEIKKKFNPPELNNTYEI